MQNKWFQNPWIKLLICYFTGIFGVHKFIEKKIGMGILYLCSFGLFGIGWIIDTIKYLVAAIKSTIGTYEVEKIEGKTNVKEIILWVLTGIFVLLSIIFLFSGNILSWVFAILFIALVFPYATWQNVLQKFLKGKLKIAIAVVLAVVSLATLSPAEEPSIEVSESTISTTDSATDENVSEKGVLLVAPVDSSPTESTTEATTAVTEVSTVPTTKAPEEQISEAKTEPATEPATVPTQPANSTFSIHFIDVGQADAALVECDGHYMLIDGGNKADSNVIYSVLKHAAVPKLDIVVGTHGHEDHIGGLPGAFNYTTADLTLCSVTNYDSDAFSDFCKYADQKGGGIVVPKAGDIYPLGSASVKILGVNGGSDANDTSIILQIDYGKTSFLFTGDAEREAEQAVLNAGMDLSATVLKVGHHGSDTSTTYPFLREVMPQYAVISVGEDNSYGHPTDDTLSRLRDADVQVYRTDMQGDIFCESDGETVTMTVSRNADADVLSGPMATEPPTDHPTEVPTEVPTEEMVEGTDYVGNKNTDKFHYAWCSSVDRMKESNKFYYTGSRDDMIGMGYEPCKNCDP